ncbi:EamA family transporter [Flavobacterium sp. '19STA2R22 D10 B1']|uniref:EamA family transporter n=1 Tax=Flavobacterium aerium TaxID=3037261 RepID=UPI00278C474E|nr:EamA family transporter [Flavobacterium sp. '19STA2R22 D10 B1']
MLQNQLLKGVFLVGLGASSYGMLATFVKMAYDEGYTTAEVTTSQFVLGIIGMLLINTYQKSKNKGKVTKATTRNVFQLMLAGTSLGCTSLFYYLAVKTIPVSMGIVLLMQTVWMGVVLEMILTKKLPSLQKTIATVVVLVGTALALNLFGKSIDFNQEGFVTGLLWGLCAACSYTVTMFTSNKVATELSTSQRSLYMLLGGAVIVFAFAMATHTGEFHFDIFLKWGIVLSLFGTIIPPMLLNAGFPITGIGLGSIVTSVEIPVSVMMAHLLLKEEVLGVQWLGIAMIIMAIVIMNIKNKSNAGHI